MNRKQCRLAATSQGAEQASMNIRSILYSPATSGAATGPPQGFYLDSLSLYLYISRPVLPHLATTGEEQKLPKTSEGAFLA